MYGTLWYSIRWYMRAIKAIYDPIDRYIYTWISFEMLMSRIVGEDKNFDDGIEKLINDKHISNDCIDHIVSRYYMVRIGPKN